MTAILFGSISTLADTSELQRQAFNEAFAEHGLDWRWDRDDYRALLDSNGGRDRVAAYAHERGEDVDATAVHATKSSLFQEKLAEADLVPRPGVAETVRAAKEAGVRLGFVTTTSSENVKALREALKGKLDLDDFDAIVSASDVADPKPDPAAYAFALQNLGEDVDRCVAIEDNVGGVASARAAGVTVVAFPNVNTAEHDFAAADTVVDELSFEALTGLVGRA